MNRLFATFGRALAHFLSRPVHGYEPFAISDPTLLAVVLQPADVLLVEGNLRISTAIKYLTQSTWSHAALYVGDFRGTGAGLAAPVLIEADVEHGVIAVPLTKYAALNTRICRPVGLSAADAARVVRYAIGRLGHGYDLRNVIDLARYLLPVPPVPVSWRRRMLAFGGGDPTREILHIRHYSLYTPRDFDISPYFRVLKPVVENGFDYQTLEWADARAGGAAEDAS